MLFNVSELKKWDNTNPGCSIDINQEYYSVGEELNEIDQNYLEFVTLKNITPHYYQGEKPFENGEEKNPSIIEVKNDLVNVQENKSIQIKNFSNREPVKVFKEKNNQQNLDKFSTNECEWDKSICNRSSNEIIGIFSISYSILIDQYHYLKTLNRVFNAWYNHTLSK